MSSNMINVINFGFNRCSNFHKRNQTIFELILDHFDVAGAVFVEQPVWWSKVYEPGMHVEPPSKNSVSYAYKVRRHIIPPVVGSSKIFKDLSCRLLERELDRSFKTVGIWNHTLHSLSETYLKIWEKSEFKIVDLSDDFLEFTQGDRRQKLESILASAMRSADLVISINRKTYDYSCLYTKNALLLPNGTNIYRFGDLSSNHTTIEKIRSINKPKIGYMGFLSERRLDIDLLEKLSDEQHGWVVCLVGPRVESFPKAIKGNCMMFDPVPYYCMKSLLQSFDVCIIPNLVNSHTDGNDPIKIYDYIGADKPIVSTPTAGIERVQSYVKVARSHEEFVAMTQVALNEREGADYSGVDTRDWKTVVGVVIERINKGLSA